MNPKFERLIDNVAIVAKSQNWDSIKAANIVLDLAQGVVDRPWVQPEDQNPYARDLREFEFARNRFLQILRS